MEDHVLPDIALSGFLSLLASAAALMASPGPATLSVAATAAAYGLRQSVPYVMGINLGTILVLLAIVHVWGIWWGLPGMPSSWAPDEFSPLLVHDAIQQKFSGGWHVLYPPGHVYLLAIVLAPIELLDRAGLVTFGSRPTYLVAFYLIRLTSIVLASATVPDVMSSPA
jgi:hypothetical protein